MAIGEFVLSGSVDMLVSDTGDVGVTLDLSHLVGVQIGFHSNVPPKSFVPITGGLMYVTDRTGIINSDGTIWDADNNTAGMRLLANDTSLGLPTPVQWRVTPDVFEVRGRSVRIKPWWFNAPAPGASVSIDTLTPVPGMDMVGGTGGGGGVSYPSQGGHAGEFLKTDGTNPGWATPAGGGDMSSTVSASIDGEVVVFNGTTGKSTRRATALSGVVKLASGLLQAVSSLGVADGGTGAATAGAARTNLGAAASATTVAGANSIAGGGDLTGNRTLALVGDTATPGNGKYYGTNNVGALGYYTLPAGGGGGGFTWVDNGNGTITFTGTGFTDNGDGTITFT